MIEHISIIIPSVRPDLLIRCIASLELYSHYSHEIIVMLDTHGIFKDTWNNFKLPNAGIYGDWKKLLSRRSSKHNIKIFLSTRYQDMPLTSTFKARTVCTGKSVEPIVCVANDGARLSTYDWVLHLSDDDFYYLPDWDYHLLKHVDTNNKKIIYLVKQLVPREVKAAKQKGAWIGFEHPKGSNEGNAREKTPLHLSYALEETKSYREDKAVLTPMLNFDHGHNIPLLIHKDTILKAGGKNTLLESCDVLWGAVDARWTCLRGFDKYGCKKCSVQNSNVLHYPGCLIDDLQDPSIRWIGRPFINPG